MMKNKISRGPVLAFVDIEMTGSNFECDSDLSGFFKPTLFGNSDAVV